jgi:hypothetical protein
MRKPGIIIVFAIVAGGIIAGGMTRHVLTLRDNDTIIFIRAVEPADTFLLKYLHSVSLTDVWEQFKIDSGFDLVLTETRFKGQGAGLPIDLSHGEKLVRKDDWFIISGMKRKIPLLYWRVQALWQDRFRFKNEPEINVSKIYGDALILINVDEMKAIEWAYQRLYLGIQHLMKERP